MEEVANSKTLESDSADHSSDSESADLKDSDAQLADDAPSEEEYSDSFEGDVSSDDSEYQSGDVIPLKSIPKFESMRQSGLLTPH